MKKLGIFLLVLMLSFNVACSKGETAEQATANALSAIKTLDKESLSKYMDYNDLVESNEDGNGEKAEEADEQLKKIFENLDYKIVSTDEKENEAVVKAEITNVDMEKVMGEVIKNAFAEAFSQAFTSSEEQQSDNESEQVINEYFSQAIEENKDSKVVNTVDIKLTKVDGQWKINMNDELQNALMGNMLRIANQLKNVFN